MKKIALITDSTADIPQDLAISNNINIIPLNISFSNETIKDNQITSEEFYTRLETGSTLPKTSQPSPEEFISLYSELFKKYTEIISIHISSALSGTLNSAYLAREKFSQPIHIVDTRNISLGASFMVLEAAECINENLSAPEIIKHLEKIRKNIETVFTLNTMEYLYKGGRIGKVSGLLGSALNIKPVIRVNDEGAYVPYGKTRNQKKALDKIVAFFEDLSQKHKVKRLAVAHGKAPKAAQYLSQRLTEKLKVPINIFTSVGPVIGVHTGPGTVGAAIQMEQQ